jgi:hypothetical protein
VAAGASAAAVRTASESDCDVWGHLGTARLLLCLQRHVWIVFGGQGSVMAAMQPLCCCVRLVFGVFSVALGAIVCCCLPPAALSRVWPQAVFCRLHL